MDTSQHYTVVDPTTRSIHDFDSQYKAQQFVWVAKEWCNKKCYLYNLDNKNDYAMVQWWRKYLNL